MMSKDLTDKKLGKILYMPSAINISTAVYSQLDSYVHVEVIFISYNVE